MINTSFRATLVPYIGKSGIVEAYSMLVFFFFLVGQENLTYCWYGW